MSADAVDRIVTPEMWLELTSAGSVSDATSDWGALRKRYATVERIYCGSDTCLREFEAAVSCFAQLQQLGKALTLVVPPLPQRSFPLFEKFLLAIQPSQTALEICVNDLGAFTRAAAIIREADAVDFCQVTVGRWLARQDTDPQLAAFCDQQQDERSHLQRLVEVDGEVKRLSYEPPGPALQRHWSTPSVFGTSTLQVFRQLQGTDKDASGNKTTLGAVLSPTVLRVELDQQAHNAPAPAGIVVSLHTEGSLVSMLPCSDCSTCPTEKCLFGTDRFSAPLYRKRNAIIA